jgi:hypothetical protein
MPRFVILEHDHPELHWDLMLESGGMLRTWRLARPPQTPGEPIDALALPNHRLYYLDFEGPVSGGRGNVQRWDTGQYEQASDGTLCFDGTRLRGTARLKVVREDRWKFEWVSC